MIIKGKMKKGKRIISFIAVNTFLSLTLSGCIGIVSTEEKMAETATETTKEITTEITTRKTTTEPTTETTTETTTKKETTEATTTTTVVSRSAVKQETTYVLNTSSKKFHYSGCREVNKMKEKNKKTYEGTREEVVNMGYDPCGVCKP